MFDIENDLRQRAHRAMTQHGVHSVITPTKKDKLMEWSDLEVSQTAYGGDYTFLNSTQIELDGTFSKSDLVKFIEKMTDK